VTTNVQPYFTFSRVTPVELRHAARLLRDVQFKFIRVQPLTKAEANLGGPKSGVSSERGGFSHAASHPSFRQNLPSGNGVCLGGRVVTGGTRYDQHVGRLDGRHHDSGTAVVFHFLG